MVMAAVVVDVVFPAHLAISRYVDAAGYLIVDDLTGAPGKNGLRIVAHAGEGVGPFLGGMLGVRARGSTEPVGQLDVVRLRVSADGRGKQLHAGGLLAARLAAA
jgi:hypothetical protein